MRVKGSRASMEVAKRSGVEVVRIWRVWRMVRRVFLRDREEGGGFEKVELRASWMVMYRSWRADTRVCGN